MEVYFARDLDPLGGFLEVYADMPDCHRITIQEVRKGEFPEDTWNAIDVAELKPDPVKHYDEIFEPYWEKATLVWTRKGGFVNGNE